MLRLAEPIPRHPRLRYRNATRGGGTEVRYLPLLVADGEGIPAGLDGLLLASDLQGIAPVGEGTDLLGVAAAEWCAAEIAGAGLARPERVGVVLAGDLYSAPSAAQRGGYGDV